MKELICVHEKRSFVIPIVILQLFFIENKMKLIFNKFERSLESFVKTYKKNMLLFYLYRNMLNRYKRRGTRDKKE